MTNPKGVREAIAPAIFFEKTFIRIYIQKINYSPANFFKYSREDRSRTKEMLSFVFISLKLKFYFYHLLNSWIDLLIWSIHITIFSDSFYLSIYIYENGCKMPWIMSNILSGDHEDLESTLWNSSLVKETRRPLINYEGEKSFRPKVSFHEAWRFTYLCYE